MDTANQINQDNQYNLRRLVAVVKASLNTFNLLICISDTLECRDDIIKRYEAELNQQEIMCSRVRLDRSSLSLKQSLQGLIAEQTNLLYVKSVVTVLGADELFGIELKNWGADTDRFFFSLQWTREALMQFKVPIVIWMDPQTADGAATSAPDFWSWRGGIFRFQAPVKEKSSISQFTDRRQQDLQNILSRYYEQLAGLENALVLSASEDRVRIRQRIEYLKSEMQAYEQELGRLNLKNNPRKSLLSIFDRIESQEDSLFQQRIRILSEDYERVLKQLSITINPVERARLERQLDQLEERFTLLEQQLDSTIAQEGHFVPSKNIMNVIGGQGLQVNEKQDQPIIQIQGNPTLNFGTSATSVTTMNTSPLSVFISYAHADEELKNELVVHLATLKRQGKIKAWQDRDIEAGAEWDQEIKANLEAAEIILLLITPRFLASDYCFDLEMQRAVERHNAGTARVIPIVLKPCDWQGTPFSKLQGLPKDCKPVTKWDDRDEAFLDVVKGIRRAVESLQAKKSQG